MKCGFQTKTVEMIRLASKKKRIASLKKAGYNLFSLDSADVYIDLLTDSGTCAQFDTQRAAAELYDCRYAGSKSFTRLQKSVHSIFGFRHLLPCHQGRAAEHVLNKGILSPGNIVIGNYHFDTTRAHIEDKGGIAVDCPIAELYDTASRHPFKGNLDLEKTEELLVRHKGNIAYILITVTCNSGGGQPVSLGNIVSAAALARLHGVPLFLDAARIFENAYFIKKREKEHAKKSIRNIVLAITAFCDGMLMSAKKNGLVHMGGFIALRDHRLYDRLLPLLILHEGFATYGGMASRDMEMLAVGLAEWSKEETVGYYIEEHVAYLGKLLKDRGIPVLEPFGGHAIYINVKEFLPDIPQEQLPGQALACALYAEGGIRTCEIGTSLAGRDPATNKNRYPRLELVRLAIPRLALSKDHLLYVANVVEAVFKKRASITGLAFDTESPILRHFLSTFKPIS